MMEVTERLCQAKRGANSSGCGQNITTTGDQTKGPGGEIGACQTKSFCYHLRSPVHGPYTYNVNWYCKRRNERYYIDAVTVSCS